MDVLTLEWPGERVNLNLSPVVFSKMYFPEKGWNHVFLWLLV